MAHRHTEEAVERSARFLRGNDEIFGGMVFVGGGDFRQIPPVVRNALPPDIVRASPRSSPLWDHVKVYHLWRPVRDAGDPAYSSFVDSLGDGSIATDPETGLAELPIDNVTTDLDEAIDFAFPVVDFSKLEDRDTLWKEGSSAIIVTTNLAQLEIKQRVLDRLSGSESVFFAANKLDVGATLEPAELTTDDFMKNFDIPGEAPPTVRFKPGALVFFTRNLNRLAGANTNALAIVEDMNTRLITVRVLANGKVDAIPSCYLHT